MNATEFITSAVEEAKNNIGKDIDYRFDYERVGNKTRTVCKIDYKGKVLYCQFEGGKSLEKGTEHYKRTVTEITEHYS